ncbi:S24 family peptidase [Hafnia alvei]|uniref:HumD family translesion DNA polymerase n=1 Tax=Hafnia alvei TaxID=569 RepID=UPI00103E7D89|nr:S24 family peptidase [Hafnia alvei]QBJ32943.1 hypothetical protein EYZ02_08575 [Hafnia alvei]
MGFPSPAADYTDKPISLDELFIKTPHATYFMKCPDYCPSAGVLKDALLVIDSSKRPVHGSVVIAALCGEFVLRRLLTMPVPCLAKLENYDDVTFADEEAGFEIFGVVTHVVNDMSMSEFDDNPCI